MGPTIWHVFSSHSRRRVPFPVLLLLPLVRNEVSENWRKTSHPTCNIDVCAQATKTIWPWISQTTLLSSLLKKASLLPTYIKKNPLNRPKHARSKILWGVWKKNSTNHTVYFILHTFEKCCTNSWSIKKKLAKILRSKKKKKRFDQMSI